MKGKRRVLFSVHLKGDVKRRKCLRRFCEGETRNVVSKKSGKDYREYPQALRETISGFENGVSRTTMKFHSISRVMTHQREEKWWVRQGVGLNESFKMACETGNQRKDSLCLFPKCSVAVSLDREVKGRAFTTLQRRSTGYPVHVNARWCLSDNRNALLGVNDSASQHVEQRWNTLLIKDAIPHLWIELLEELKSDLSDMRYYQLFPKAQK